jgi:CRISPR-associated protein Cmx8
MANAICLDYDLRDLPSAQHRAGLAGFVLAVDTLRRRGLGPVPDIECISSYQVRAHLTEQSLTAVLNDLYDATTKEITQRQKRKGQTPIREVQIDDVDKKTGAIKKRTVYVYSQIVPRAEPLEVLGMPPIWRKLWIDAIWSTIRGIPKTRIPYEQRAQGRDVDEAVEIWHALQRGIKDPGYETDIASPLLVGAQAFSAERVPFRGRPAVNLLLHFWQLVAGVGEVLRTEFDRKKKCVQHVSAGYVFAVPDVANIEDFIDQFPRSLAELDKKLFPDYQTSRPRDAVLALPAEGGLQFLRRLTELAHARAAQSETRYAVNAIEVFHLEKRKNTIALLGTTSIPARPELAEGYKRITAMRLRSQIFRGQIIRNLLDEKAWYFGFDALLDTLDPRVIADPSSGFASDAYRKLAAEIT